VDERHPESRQREDKLDPAQQIKGDRQAAEPVGRQPLQFMQRNGVIKVDITQKPVQAVDLHELHGSPRYKSGGPANIV